MLEIRKRSLFKRDLKAVANNPAALEKICAIVFRLANGETLPPSCREHPLKGDYAGTTARHATKTGMSSPLSIARHAFWGSGIPAA